MTAHFLQYTNTGLLTFLAWNMHVNKKWHAKLHIYTSPFREMIRACKCKFKIISRYLQYIAYNSIFNGYKTVKFQHSQKSLCKCLQFPFDFDWIFGVRGYVFVCQTSYICVLEIMYLCQRSCICVLKVMYLCVRGHVFVYYRSCICVLEVMYLCIRGHVFVYQRSCICVLEVMYLCVRGHVFVYQRSCICGLEVMYLCISVIDFCLFLRF